MRLTVGNEVWSWIMWEIGEFVDSDYNAWAHSKYINDLQLAYLPIFSILFFVFLPAKGPASHSGSWE
jgi:hypothetical protein